MRARYSGVTLGLGGRVLTPIMTTQECRESEAKHHVWAPSAPLTGAGGHRSAIQPQDVIEKVIHLHWRWCDEWLSRVAGESRRSKDDEASTKFNP